MGENNHIILVNGKYSSGKTSSLRNMPMDKTVVINCDGKPLSFKGTPYKNIKLPNVDVLLPGLDTLEQDEQCEYIVLDTLSFLMEMYETEKIYTLPKNQQMGAWTPYGQFFREMIHKMKRSKKKIVVLCHTQSIYNESEMETEVKAYVKGSVGKVGVESHFSTVVAAKKIKDDDAPSGFRYVFQTSITKDTINEGIRSPIGMWADDELYIDNDVMLVFDKITKYYGEEK